MLRVALVTENYPPDRGGIATSAARLSSALAGAVHVDVITFPRGPGDGPDTWSTEARTPELAVHTVGPFVNGWDRPAPALRARLIDRAARRLASTLGTRIDIIHGFGLQNAGLVATRAAALLRRPLVQSVRGNDVGRNSFDAARRPALHASLRAATVITSVNEWLADLIRWQWPQLDGRLRVLPNGVSIHPLTARTTHVDAWSGPIVGTIGSVREKKGPHVLNVVAAACLVPRGGTLLVIGDLQLEHFHGLGWRSALDAPVVRCVRAADATDLRCWIERCDVCLFPSLDDGMANGLLEAMERGRPVIASTVFADVIRHGRDGLLASPLRPDAFVAACDRLLDDAALRAQLGVAARARVESMFDAARERDAWLDVYRTSMETAA